MQPKFGISTSKIPFMHNVKGDHYSCFYQHSSPVSTMVMEYCTVIEYLKYTRKQIFELNLKTYKIS